MRTAKKKCSKCEKGKTLDHFYKDSKSIDGLQSQCDSCKNIRSDRGTNVMVILPQANKRKLGRPLGSKNKPKITRFRKESVLVRMKKKRMGRKKDSRTIAGMHLGDVVKLGKRKFLIEKIKKSSPTKVIKNIPVGKRAVILKRLHRDGEHFYKGGRPVIIEKKHFLYALTHNGQLSAS